LRRHFSTPDFYGNSPPATPQGDSAIQIARKFGSRQKNFTGEHFWARGYFVSTVGLDENMVRAYIRNQEDEDERYDQMKLEMG